MRTREVIALHWSPRDLVELARLCAAAALLTALDAACGRVERWIDERGGRC